MKNKLVSVQLQPKDIVNKMEITIEEWKILWTNYWSIGYEHIHWSKAFLIINEKDAQSLCNLISMFLDENKVASDKADDTESRIPTHFLMIIKKLLPEKKKEIYTIISKNESGSFLRSLFDLLYECEKSPDKDATFLVQREIGLMMNSIYHDQE